MLPLSKGKTRESVSEGVGFTFDVMKMDAIVFKEKTPPHNPLSGELLESVVFVVGVDVDIRTTIEHGAELFKSLNNGKKLFLANGVVALCRIELAGVKGHRLVVLEDGCAELNVGSISINVEWFVVIGEAQKRCLCHQGFHAVECFGAFVISRKLGTFLEAT